MGVRNRRNVNKKRKGGEKHPKRKVQEWYTEGENGTKLGENRKCLCIVNEKNSKQDNNGLIYKTLKRTAWREKIIKT